MEDRGIVEYIEETIRTVGRVLPTFSAATVRLSHLSRSSKDGTQTPTPLARLRDLRFHVRLPGSRRRERGIVM